MKKLVLSVFALAAFGFAASAQEKEKSTFGFQQGDIFVEGGYSLVSNVSESELSGQEVKITSYTFTPKGGYFLTDKIAIGAEFGFGKLDLGTSHQNITSAGVFGRYYFLELGKRFKTYGEVGVGYQGYTEDSIASEGNGMYAGITAGLNYFITPKFAIGFNLGTILGQSTMKHKVLGRKESTETVSVVNLNVFNNFFDQATFSLTYKF